MEDKKIKQQRNTKTCQIIAEFLDCAGMTNKAFAEFAGLNPSTFQGMMNRKTGAKQDTVNKISNAMAFLTEQMKDEDATLAGRMEILHDSFLRNVEVPLFSPKDIVKLLWDTSNRDGTLIDDGSLPFLEAAMENLNNPRSRLLDAFDQLNEKGQETAADRVQELTQIEAYRKKED